MKKIGNNYGLSSCVIKKLSRNIMLWPVRLASFLHILSSTMKVFIHLKFKWIKTFMTLVKIRKEKFGSFLYQSYAI